MKTAHTEGPWKAYDTDTDKPYIGTIAKNSKIPWSHDTICNLFEDTADKYETHEEIETFNEANAALIAAAPELLKALENLARWCDRYVQDAAVTIPLNHACTIIEKAKGL